MDVAADAERSQSLSGWDGVFNLQLPRKMWRQFIYMSQSLSGWDGVFNDRFPELRPFHHRVAIPFRVGWGFQLGIPKTVGVWD